jgi:hypothetical protein
MISSMPELSLDFFGMILAALLTIMVLSYIIADNVLFRIAVYVFIGVASGYAGAIAWHNVIRPALIDPILADGFSVLFGSEAISTYLIPLLLSAILLLKLSKRTARFGSLSVAILVGVGAAVVVGGAITGTLIPQSRATANALAPEVAFPQQGEDTFVWLERVIGVVVLILATITTLIYFRFSAQRERSGRTRRSRFNAILAYIGRTFIALTFGVMYAGALMATVLVLAQRFVFLRSVLTMLTGGG